MLHISPKLNSVTELRSAQHDRVIDLYVSCPAVSHNDSFICFWFCESVFDGVSVVASAEGSLTLRASEAGGPTGTMRLPNSTPMVTSW